MVKNATFRVLAEDLMISFRFAVKNIITFILGLIGVILVTMLTFIIGAIIIFVPLFILSGGFGPLSQFFMSLGTYFDLATPAFMGMMFVIMIPFLLPLFVAVGALFGMGREIVESAGASAEGVFTWYRRKFFPLAGGGIILFSITLLPIGLMFTIVYSLTGGPVIGPLNGMMSAISLVWVVISLGFLSMTFPGIIDGVSVIDAVRQSIRMSWDYFDRVFSVWLSFILIFTVPFAPMIAIPFGISTTTLQSPFFIGILGVFGIIFFILLLIAIPAFVIALSRMYMILSGVEIPAPEDQEPAISMVGGF